MTARPKRWQQAAIALGAPTLAVALVVGLGWNPYKRIWGDEYLQFLLAAEPSLADAWATFRTGGPVTLGQTGLNFMSTAASLKVLGASLFALRLPSMFATAWLVISLWLCGRALGMGRAVCLGMAWALVNAYDLIFFTSEARVYMSLSASALATLAFYLQAPAARRQIWWQIWGAATLVFGFLNHPYYVLYLLLSVGAGILIHRIPPREWLRTSFWEAAMPAGALGVTLAALTWMRYSSRGWGLDPFHFMTDGRSPARIFMSEHLRTLGALRFLLPLAIGWLAWKRSRVLMNGGLILIGALLASFTLSYISYRNGYWILSRQWVASLSMVHVAAFSLFHGAIEGVPAHERKRRRWLVNGIFLIAGLGSVFAQWGTYRDWRERERSLGVALLERGAALRRTLPEGVLPEESPDQIALAHLNLHEGGAVWPLFRQAYVRMRANAEHPATP